MQFKHSKWHIKIRKRDRRQRQKEIQRDRDRKRYRDRKIYRGTQGNSLINYLLEIDRDRKRYRETERDTDIKRKI